jgi:hypothetical protein
MGRSRVGRSSRLSLTYRSDLRPPPCMPPSPRRMCFCVPMFVTRHSPYTKSRYRWISIAHRQGPLILVCCLAGWPFGSIGVVSLGSTPFRDPYVPMCADPCSCSCSCSHSRGRRIDWTPAALRHPQRCLISLWFSQRQAYPPFPQSLLLLLPPLLLRLLVLIPPRPARLVCEPPAYPRPGLFLDPVRRQVRARRRTRRAVSVLACIHQLWASRGRVYNGIPNS